MQPELRVWDRAGGLDHPDPWLPAVDHHGATSELLAEGDLTSSGTDPLDHGAGPDHNELDASDQQLNR